MLKCILFLAAAELYDAPTIDVDTSKLFGYNVRDLMLLAGMGLVLATALFLYAYLTRKKRQTTIALSGSRAIYRAEPQEDADGRRRYRKRRRRREQADFLPRNPTLQETGGLPPLRPEQPPAEPTQ